MEGPRVQLYGILLSQPTRTLYEFCSLCNIPFDFVRVDLLKGEHKTEWYSQINPDQLVPAITHGDFKLAETFAIIPYLAEYYHVDNQWYPQDLHKRSHINAFFHWQHNTIRKSIRTLILEKVIGPKLRGMQPITAEREAELRADAINKLRDVTQMLEKWNFIAQTSDLSTADLACYNEIVQLKFLNFDFNEWPRIKSWVEEIERLQIVQETNGELLAVVEKFNTPQA
ncbi:unnamed protein product [Blepharisma stoltei]|uniref:Glutathione S-transferase n=1 Tax=Blepharisma stoltei TaxID=1481888 RepID=A0AAU9IS93_9CILI|nr:unnamed protein product [Blepharisma stoltei]